MDLVSKYIGCPVHNRGVIAAAGLAVGYLASRSCATAPCAADRKGAETPPVYHSNNKTIISSPTDGSEGLPEFPIYRVAVTGGPCSGKSTCMEKVKSELTAMGFHVYIVPEVATILMNGGCNMMCDDAERRIAQQRVVLQTIMMLEDSFYEMARLNKEPSIILCDRGTMDGRAYCTDEEWEAILERTGYNVEELRDARYDAVLHLVTAAIGAESFYTKANNQVRRETAEEAAILDVKTREKWLGHRMLNVIDNSTAFDEKVTRVVDFIKRLVRVQQVEDMLDPTTRLPKKQHLKQFAVKKIHGELPESTEVADVTIRVLKPHPQYREEKVIRRKTGTSTLYYHRAETLENTSKNGHMVPNVVYVRISTEQYAKLIAHRADPEFSKISKTHTTFFHNSRYFTVTKYWSPEPLANKVVLSAPHDIDEAKDLPSFIELEK